MDIQKKEQPVSMKITEIIDEAKDIKTFKFKNKISATPGQFILLWIPRVDMKPFGVSYYYEDGFGVTVCRVGKFTEKLFEKKIGDYVGIQGPYGKSFSANAKNAVLVGGGYGTAPLSFLVDELLKKGAKITFIIGAKTKEALIYESRFENSGVNMIYMTDDGSSEKKGFATDALKDAVSQDKNIDMIYTCGPEIMMKKVIEISDENNINCEASLERYMKCGFGICGQCCVDDSGICACKEGPVFTKEFIKKNISEFGKYKRDKTGNKI